jgi:Phosphotransferase enzyme family
MTAPNNLLNYLNISYIDIKRLCGGTQHSSWLVELDSLEKLVIKHVTLECWLGKYAIEQFEYSEVLADKIAHELGITISAKRYDGKVIICHSNQHYMIFPWVEGYMVNNVTLNQCYLLGQILAQIHQFALKVPFLSEFKPINIDTQLWHSCLQSEYDADGIIDEVRRCNMSLNHGQDEFIMSHRDLNLTNVIWQSENSCKIIDWESAGLIHPTVELIGLACNCAGIEEGALDWGKVSRTISGYVSIMGSHPKLNDGLYTQCYYTWCAWLNYCVERSIALNISHQDEIKLCINALSLLHTHQEKLYALFA